MYIVVTSGTFYGIDVSGKIYLFLYAHDLSDDIFSILTYRYRLSLNRGEQIFSPGIEKLEDEKPHDITLRYLIELLTKPVLGYNYDSTSNLLSCFNANLFDNKCLRL